MVRPCVARGSSIRWQAVLHQCIRSLVGAVLLRTIMDISARATSLTDRPQRGHRGHQCSHALGRPILHLVSSSRRPRLETVDRVTSLLAPDIAQFLCSSQGPFLRPGPQNVDRVARRGRSRPAVALGLRLAPALPGRALTAPSTARGSSGSDACIVGPRQLEGASFSQHRPGDAGNLLASGCASSCGATLGFNRRAGNSRLEFRRGSSMPAPSGANA